MILLALESSCDETGAAVIRDGTVAGAVVSSQVRLHAPYGGVVPELATREHLRNLPPVVATVLKQAGVDPARIEAVAATRGPGLPSALRVGYHAGQAVAFALRRPFFAVHHHEAHLYSPWIGGDPLRADFDNFEPNVSLVVSGGHTLLVLVMEEGKHRVLGATVDDAAGECFDKAARLIGLPYPGGPALERLAVEGNPAAFQFPRPMLSDPGDDFSFSGLKTAVRYLLRDHPDLVTDPGRVRDLCAAVQAAIVDVLVTKTVRAAARMKVRCVTASGGVTCNRAVRSGLEAACRKAGLTLRLAAGSLCTDNAAMIGILAERQWLRGEPGAVLDSEVAPGWSLG